MLQLARGLAERLDLLAGSVGHGGAPHWLCITHKACYVHRKTRGEFLSYSYSIEGIEAISEGRSEGPRVVAKRSMHEAHDNLSWPD